MSFILTANIILCSITSQITHNFDVNKSISLGEIVLRNNN